MMAGLDETDEQTIEAMREISSYTSLMGSSEDICAMTAIYLPEREIIVSNSTYSTKPKEFYQIFLDFEDTTAEEFYDMVSDPQLFFFSYGCKATACGWAANGIFATRSPLYWATATSTRIISVCTTLLCLKNSF